MFKRTCSAVLAILAFAVLGTAFADTDATPHQIYEAAQSGHIAQARRMIGQMLQDHPQNAKAHFVAAQLDARIGDVAAARQQLLTAQQLDPAQSFTNSNTLGELERQLTGIRPGIPGTSPLAVATQMHRSALPWGWVIVLAVGAFALWNILRPRAQPRMQPSGGPVLAGNLASGLAIGGAAPGADWPDPPQSQDLGGADFGTEDGGSRGSDGRGGGGEWS